MSKIKIVTDSSTTIEPSLVEELNITVVPLSVMVDGVVYSDNDLKKENSWSSCVGQKLAKNKSAPVGLFAETFAELAKDGSQIIAILLSHALSGTVEGATLSGADVTILDSSFTDQAEKIPSCRSSTHGTSWCQQRRSLRY